MQRKEKQARRVGISADNIFRAIACNMANKYMLTSAASQILLNTTMMDIKINYGHSLAPMCFEGMVRASCNTIHGYNKY
jgi:hypothetical protein